MKHFGQTTLATAVWLAASGVAAPAVAGGYNYHGDHGHRYDGRGGYHRYHGHHNGDAAAALGVGLVFGVLLGSAIHDRYDSRYAEPVYYSPPPAYRPAPRVVYREAPVITVAQRPAGACVQEREYQTRVTVNGRQVEAYGVACLQPDGTWRQGAPRLVPEF